MDDQHLYVKNMVCPRCIVAVKDALDHFSIPFDDVALGQITLKMPLPETQRQTFNTHIKTLGFELLESGKSKIISQIKTLIIDRVHHNNRPLKENLSTFLTEQLHHEYSYMSRLFSSVEGVTIERFVAQQKIEKVKELLFYGELTLSEIALALHYSSVAYLSSQFKKETGMTPTQFKNQKTLNRASLDAL